MKKIITVCLITITCFCSIYASSWGDIYSDFCDKGVEWHDEISQLNLAEQQAKDEKELEKIRKKRRKIINEISKLLINDETSDIRKEITSSQNNIVKYNADIIEMKEKLVNAPDSKKKYQITIKTKEDILEDIQKKEYKISEEEQAIATNKNIIKNHFNELGFDINSKQLDILCLPSFGKSLFDYQVLFSNITKLGNQYLEQIEDIPNESKSAYILKYYKMMMVAITTHIVALQNSIDTFQNYIDFLESEKDDNIFLMNKTLDLIKDNPNMADSYKKNLETQKNTDSHITKLNISLLLYIQKWNSFIEAQTELLNFVLNSIATYDIRANITDVVDNAVSIISTMDTFAIDIMVFDDPGMTSALGDMALKLETAK